MQIKNSFEVLLFLIVIIFSGIWAVIKKPPFIKGDILNDSIIIGGLFAWLVVNIVIIPLILKDCFKRKIQRAPWKIYFLAACLVLSICIILSFAYSLLALVMVPVALFVFGISLLVSYFSYFKKHRGTVITVSFLLIAISLSTLIFFLNALSNFG